MKRIYLYTVSACLLLLSACSSDNSELPGVGNNSTPSAALRIEVSASDFTHAGGANTRATDSGKETTFEPGDRIGITALDESGNILYDNIPYKYNKSDNNKDTWEFDNNNGEGKTALYYDKQAKTYLAYFPYSEKANGATDEGKLKELFPPLPDQRSKYAYRASDLLLGGGELSDGSPSDGSQKTLNIAFEHAYSSLSFPSSVEVTCTIANGLENYSYSALVRDVSFTIKEELFLPYQMSDGSYRIVVSPETAPTSVDCLFGVGGGRMYSNTMNFETLVDKTLYTLTLSSNKPLDIGEYGLEMARLGDFYCKDTETQIGYLIPGDAKTEIITAHKDVCLGIVFWVGSEAYNDDPLLKRNHPGCTHGLVVSLQEVGAMHWSDSYEMITTKWVDKEGNPYKGVVDLQSDKKRCGYSNTLALVDYNAKMYSSNVGSNNNYRVLPIDAIQEFSTRHPAPVNSSGWYFPSVMELKYVCWGQGNDGNAKGKDMLNPKIEKLGGNTFVNDYYWSSTEDSYSGSHAWYVGFDRGNVNNFVSKYNNRYRVRPLLAF